MCLAFLLFLGYQGPSKENSSTGKPPCVKGHVWLAKAPRKIRFSFTCQLPDSRKIARLSIVQFSKKGPHAGPGISDVSAHLRIENGSSERARGSCVLSKEVASCVVRGTGRVKATGWVDPIEDDRCKRRVALSVTRPPKCSENRCELVLDIDYLWKRLPAGC